jgi:hypothetical protein
MLDPARRSDEAADASFRHYRARLPKEAAYVCEPVAAGLRAGKS